MPLAKTVIFSTEQKKAIFTFCLQNPLRRATMPKWFGQDEIFSIAVFILLCKTQSQMKSSLVSIVRLHLWTPDAARDFICRKSSKKAKCRRCLHCFGHLEKCRKDLRKTQPFGRMRSGKRLRYSPARQFCRRRRMCFSPFAMDEYTRILKDGGILILAYPCENHLIELRHALYKNVREVATSLPKSNLDFETKKR